VYLSEDNRKLCWQDKDSPTSKAKDIEISSIRSVDKGGIGPGI